MLRNTTRLRVLGPTLDLPRAEMLRLGRHALDMVARHLAGLGRARVGRVGTRARMRALLDEPAPRRGRAPLAVLRRCERQILGYTMAAHHPRFFAFIPSGAAYPGVLGDLLASGFNVFAGTWLEASGPAQIELTVLDWFRRWLGMPPSAGGLMLSGGSAANLTALVAARESVLGRLPRRERARAVVYLSDQAHASIERAARVLDLPPANLRCVPSDDSFRMSVPALEAALERDLRRGLRPMCVAVSTGSTNTGSVDPLQAVARLCRRRRVWLHVDAAYGGFAVLSRRGRALLRGIGLADSVTLDPHKWLFAPFDVGCLLVRDRALLRRAFAIHPEYLQDIRAEDEEVNFYEYGTQLTRAFRALKVWMIVQMYGTARLAGSIERALELARRADAWLRARGSFEILAPTTLGIVCFRYLPRPLRGPGAPGARGGASGPAARAASGRPGARSETLVRRINEEIVRRMRQDRRSFFTSTLLRGRYALRLCILGHRTRWPHVLQTLDSIEAAGARVEAALGRSGS